MTDSTCKVVVCHTATGEELEGRASLEATGNLSTMLLRKLSETSMDEQRNESALMCCFGLRLQVWSLAEGSMNRESALVADILYHDTDQKMNRLTLLFLVFFVNWGWLHDIQFDEPRGSARFKMFLSNCVSRQSRCSATQTWPDLNFRNVC